MKTKLTFILAFVLVLTMAISRMTVSAAYYGDGEYPEGGSNETDYYESETTPPPIVIDTGSLTVAKSVSGLGASAAEKFALTVTFAPGAPAFWNVLGISAPAAATGGSGTYTLSLSANDGAVTFTNIPVGTTYTVTEAITAAQTTAGWTAGTSTGATGSISIAGASAVIANVFSAPAVLGTSDVQESSPAVLGATDTLPQTDGISSATLLGIFGLALIAIGGTTFILFRNKNTGKSK